MHGPKDEEAGSLTDDDDWMLRLSSPCGPSGASL